MCLMSNGFSLMQRRIRSTEIPCGYVLELDSSLFIYGTTEVGICPLERSGLDRGFRCRDWRCVYHRYLLEAMEVLRTSAVGFAGLTSMRLSYFELYLQLTYLEREMFGCTIHGSGFLRDTPWIVNFRSLPSNLLES